MKMTIYHKSSHRSRYRYVPDAHDYSKVLHVQSAILLMSVARFWSTCCYSYFGLAFLMRHETRLSIEIKAFEPSASKMTESDLRTLFSLKKMCNSQPGCLETEQAAMAMASPTCPYIVTKS
jgi:hypothetical protein